MVLSKKIVALATLMAPMVAITAKPVSETNVKAIGIPERVMILSGDSASVDGRMMAVIYDTKDIHFHDQVAPRFLFIDRMGTTALGIGGYVEGVAQYDFNGAIENAGFVTYAIPIPRDPAERSRLAADATSSTIFLRLVRQTDIGILSAYVQTEFSGNNRTYGLTVTQAYLQVNNITAGLTNSTFFDASAGVSTIDYQGPSGQFGVKNLIFKYNPQLTKHISAAISVENPMATYTTIDNQNEKIAQRVPDIPAYIQYGWDEGNQHIRLSGLFRDLSYRNLVSQKNCFAKGWGVQLSTVFKPVSQLIVRGQVGYGKGIGRYVNDLSGNGYDLVPAADGAMKAPGDLGIVGGIQYNIRKNLFTSASYSVNRAYSTSSMGPDAYRRANYFVVNCMWTASDSFQVGVEYLFGKRTNVNHEHGYANRVQAMMKYSF